MDTEVAHNHEYFWKDLEFADAVYSGGYHTGGRIENTSLHRVEWDYTQTVEPAADSYIGSAYVVEWNATINSNTGVLGATTQASRVLGQSGVFALEGSLTYQKNQSVFKQSPITFASQVSIGNDSGSTRNINPPWVYMNNNHYIANGGTVNLVNSDTLKGGAGFIDNPVFATTNSGVMQSSSAHMDYEIISFASVPFATADVTVPERTGFLVADMNATKNGVNLISDAHDDTEVQPVGTITRQRGLKVYHLSTATENIGIENESNTVNMAHDVELTAATDTITLTATTIHVDNTSGGDLTLTSSPTIPNGYDYGQIITVVNVSSSGDSFTMSNNLAETITLAPGQAADLVWTTDGSSDFWLRVGGSTNSGIATFANVTSIDDGDSPYTVVANDSSIRCDTTSGSITVNLPAATGSGRTLNIKKLASANTVTVDGNSSDTIDGGTTAVLTTQYESITIQDVASNTWDIL